MKWGYSGYTKSETRRLVHNVKEKEDLQSYIDDSDECDVQSLKSSNKLQHKLKDKEF